jgi:hypothetical protein
MERIVIESRRVLTLVVIALSVVLIAMAVVIALYVELDTVMIIRLLLLIVGVAVMLFISRRMTRSGKEMIVIDSMGLTINSDIMMGPIPWDCISDAKVVRIIFEKHLYLTISDMPKMRGLFGEEAVRKKVGKNRKTGEDTLFMDLDFCKLRGIDLEALIKERANGRKD